MRALVVLVLVLVAAGSRTLAGWEAASGRVREARSLLVPAIAEGALQRAVDA